MKTALSFLVAARQGEISELEQLALTSELVGVIARFIHTLQRERGLSNVFLASRGALFGAQRLAQAAQCDSACSEMRERFDALDLQAGRVRNGARLFGRIAVVLHALEGLPALRQRVDAQQLLPAEATALFARLINGLLAVVFEAADSASDPGVSRALVAMFNFMQGKEFAGLERAFGGSVFASGRIDAPTRQHWEHLIESQARCLQVFADLADPAVVLAWRGNTQAAASLITLERLRRSAWGQGGDTVDGSHSTVWYDTCTARIDAMREVEALLATGLRQLCEARIASARSELRDEQASLGLLQQQAAAASVAAPAGLGPQLERSVLDLVQAQARRLQVLGDELEAARAALNERKLVERAKGLLMKSARIDEDAAYQRLRRQAMDRGLPLHELARQVIEAHRLRDAGLI
jgi:hypothetical protein